MIRRGSLVCLVIVSLFLWFVTVTSWFFVWMVIFGSNPMNEYWASFSGPSIDSKR